MTYWVQQGVLAISSRDGDHLTLCVRIEVGDEDATDGVGGGGDTAMEMDVDEEEADDPDAKVRWQARTRLVVYQAGGGWMASSLKTAEGWVATV